MPGRTVVKLTRWTLLVAAALLLGGLAALFWSDVRLGRQARETERVQSAQERAQETAAPASPPASPP